MFRICRRCWRHFSVRASRHGLTIVTSHKETCTSCGRTASPRRNVKCSSPGPARCCRAGAGHWPSRWRGRSDPTLLRSLFHDGRPGRGPPRPRRLRPGAPLRDAAPLALPRRAAGARPPAPEALAPSRPDLEFYNGLGGFAEDAREYVTVLGQGGWTPSPWINVIANPGFGFQVSESGSGYTWSVNSRENQLTAWSNDPISDPPGETIYVRDEETGDVWGPTALPIREETSPYVIRHGQGYTRFEHVSHGISLELLQLVPLNDPVKISRLTIENRSGKS